MDLLLECPDSRAALSAEDLKGWLRSARRAAGLTQPQLAKRIDVPTLYLFRWEHAGSDSMPTRYLLDRIAAQLGVESPPTAAGVLASDAAFEEETASDVDLGVEPLEDAAALKRWIRYVRRRSRMTQAALAGFVGVSVVTVHKWEHQAARQIPRWKHFKQIALACGVQQPQLGPSLILRGRPDPARAQCDALPPPADTLLAEIRQTAQRLALCYAGRTTQARNAELFVDYYGRGHTLQTIGDASGLTRERVRQIIARLMEWVPMYPAPRVKFLELAGRCESLEPMPLAKAEELLADLLGGVPLTTAITYGAHVLGEGLSVEIDTGQVVPMLMPRGVPNWVPSALRHSRRIIRFNGAALLDQVWAATQSEHNAPISQEALCTALQGVRGFAWLDPTKQWFWFGPEDGANRVLDWSRRMLAVAGRRVDVEHMHSGLARFTAKYDDHSPTTAVPPTAQVLLAMLACCSDIEVKQKDDLKLVDHTFVWEHEPDTVIERTLDLLKTRGGVMARGDLVDELVERQGGSSVSLSVQLATSPLLRRLDHGIYAIRGWHLSTEDVARAWKRNQNGSAIEVFHLAEGGLAWEMILTEAVLSNDRLYLPQRVIPAMAIGRIRVRGGGEVRVVGATRNPQLRGLTELALGIGAQAGDRLRITIWPQLRECAVEPI